MIYRLKTVAFQDTTNVRIVHAAANGKEGVCHKCYVACGRATNANLHYTGEGDDPVSERDFLHNRPPPERGFNTPGTWYAEEGDSEYK